MSEVIRDLTEVCLAWPVSRSLLFSFSIRISSDRDRDLAHRRVCRDRVAA